MNDLKEFLSRWLRGPMEAAFIADLADIIEDEDRTPEKRAHEIVTLSVKWGIDQVNTRAALPAPAVKPLVWQNFDAWTFWTESLCGTYYVTERNGTWIAELKSQGSVHIIYEIDDYDTAKAAAQADYEARIRSALVDRGGWQPIETAPKDGFFLIADFRVIDADWDCSVVVAHRDIHGGFLAYMDEEGAEIPYLDGTPTHWMPLPSPPTTEGEG